MVIAVLGFGPVVLGLVGPFGTYGVFPFALRWLYWAAIALAGAGFFSVFRHSLVRALELERIWVEVVSSLATAAVLAPVIWYTSWAVLGISPDMLPSVWEPALAVLSCCAGLILLKPGLPAEAGIDRSQNLPNKIPLPDFLDRFQPDLEGELISVSADNHYLNVRTCTGEARVLMRFSDAIRELEGFDGLRIHRSHWIARNKVQQVDRDGGRSFVILTNGERLPVSAAYRDALKDHGLV